MQNTCENAASEVAIASEGKISVHFSIHSFISMSPEPKRGSQLLFLEQGGYLVSSPALYTFPTCREESKLAYQHLGAEGGEIAFICCIFPTLAIVCNPHGGALSLT